MNRTTEFLNRYEPYRRGTEVGFWLSVFAINAIGNSLTAIQDVERYDLPFASWEALTWETSSALAHLALVLPVVWLTARYPLAWRNWRWLLAIHLAGAIGYTLAHVGMMVGLREAVYAIRGGNYSFGDWPRELLYEFLKDARTYFGLVITIEGYRFLLLRLRGEARWPDPPDPAIDPDPAADQDLPERFLVKMLGREFLVPADKIESVSAAGNYVNLHVAGKEYPLRSTMKDLMARLNPDCFQRVHRSHAIHLDQLKEILPGEHGEATLVLSNGQTLPCSRSFRNQLNERLQKPR